MRKRGSVRLLLVTLLGLLVLLAPVGPASAGEAQFTDPRGDAPAPHDITRVDLRNNRDRVTVRMRIADLDLGQQVARSYFQSVRADLRWVATTVLHSNRRITASLRTFNGSELERVDCRVVSSWQVAGDTVRISFPQSCLDIHRALRVRSLLGAGNATSGDPTDWTKTARVPYA